MSTSFPHCNFDSQYHLASIAYCIKYTVLQMYKFLQRLKLNLWVSMPIFGLGSSKLRNPHILALAHYTQNCKKFSYCPYLMQLFFTTVTIFSTVSYMSNDFITNFLKRSQQFSVYCVRAFRLHCFGKNSDYLQSMFVSRSSLQW